jgi:hypothetical protein
MQGLLLLFRSSYIGSCGDADHPKVVPALWNQAEG